MPHVALAATFAESRRILKSADYVPTAMADRYRDIGERLGEDFSPAIRLLELLPVFVSGPRHANTRRDMALRIAAARPQQLHALQQHTDRLPALLAPGQTIDLLARFVRPLWQALADAASGGLHLPASLVSGCTDLFDSRSRLRARLTVNEALREFIAADPATADQRLLILGQTVLGIRPFIGSLTLSLHALFSANLGKPLARIAYPARFPLSSLPTTDRWRTSEQTDTPADERETVRCVLHSARFSTAENDEAMYGIGAHACLGRPISNDAWTMVTARLAGLDVAVASSTLALHTPLPHDDDDLLKLSDPFIKPRSLKVRIES
jgi:hypothetical protein